MTGAQWASPDQVEFLWSLFADYVKVNKGDKNYVPFWNELREKWFEMYPEHEASFPDTEEESLSTEEQARVTEDIKARIKQLKTWYRWRVNPRATTGGRRGRLADLEPYEERVRQLKDYEMYSKLYYDEKIRPWVEAVENEMEGTEFSKGEKLNLRKRVAKDLYDGETNEIKAIVVSKLKERAKCQEDQKNDETERKPHQYLRSIEDAPGVVGRFLDALHVGTGWSFSLLMGGPHPLQNGEIASASYHTGEGGANFSKSNPDFNKTCMIPFTEYLEKIYPSALRLDRVLTSDSAKEGGKDDTGATSSDEDAPLPAKAPKKKPATQPAPQPADAPPTKSSAKPPRKQKAARESMTKAKQPEHRNATVNPSEKSNDCSSAAQTTEQAKETSTMAKPIEEMNPPSSATEPSAENMKEAPFMASGNDVGMALGAGPSTNVDDVSGPVKSIFPQYVSFEDLGKLDFSQWLMSDESSFDLQNFDFSGLLPYDDGNGSGDYSDSTVSIHNDSVAATMPVLASSSAPQAPFTPTVHLPSKASAHSVPALSGALQPQLSNPSLSARPVLASSFASQAPFLPTVHLPPIASAHSVPASSGALQPQLSNPSLSARPANSNITPLSLSFNFDCFSSVSPSAPTAGATLPSVLAPTANASPSTTAVATASVPAAAAAVSVPAAPTLAAATPATSVPAPAPAPSSIPLLHVNDGNSIDTRRSGRNPVPSKRNDQMNKIDGKTQDKQAAIEKENVAPGTVPEWAVHAHNHLVTRDLGTEWAECVAAWFDLEQELGYGQKAGAKGALPSIATRPDEWATWTSKSRHGVRNYQSTPAITDPAEFGIAIATWWNNIQPPFRVSDTGKPSNVYNCPTGDGRSWAPLRKGGPNGLVSVLTLLVWWGQALATRSHWQTDSSQEWNSIVQDVTRCLVAMKGLIKSTGQKRKVTAPGKEEGAKRARVSAD